VTTSGPGNWIAPEDYADGWDEFRLPVTTDLVGRDLRIRFDRDEAEHLYSFKAPGVLVREAGEAPGAGLPSTESYDATCVGKNIYFVDFVLARSPNVAISLILDLAAGRAFSVRVTTPDLETCRASYFTRLGRDDLSAMQVEYMNGVIDEDRGKRELAPYERTRDLLGKWMKYDYTHDHVYEHIYLTDKYFAWYSTSGPDKGLAATEPCDYWKLADDLYMIVWRETVYPICGLSIIDLKNMRTMGKQCGMNFMTGKRERVVMGAYATQVGSRPGRA
jgi:hypothetical protein